MGQEINRATFSKRQFDAFLSRLKQETALLEQWLKSDRFDNSHHVAGYELEAWLVDKNGHPAAVNEPFIHRLNNPQVCPELANFNIEYNFTPRQLHQHALRNTEKEMSQLWQLSMAAAGKLDCQLAMIGILPTVVDQDLSIKNISAMNRYYALNEQVLKLRQGRPFQLDIHGNEILRATQSDVMLESATTSFQIHWQVPIDQAVRAYNASIIASAPMVAVSANSPFMYGKDLWAETRIPLFEQAVEVGGYEPAAHGPMRRVTFGSGYLHQSIFECFLENCDHYPVLLPELINDPLEKFSNLRLHNGTLWRWNRPLIGIDNDQYHLRIEHRVVPAGPSIVDTVANAAFYYGLAQNLSSREIQPEMQLPFDKARDNFYNAARYGLEAQAHWLKGNKTNIRTLILDQLLAMASQGLSTLGINADDSRYYLGIIEKRTQLGCNGAVWQRAFVAKYGNDMAALLRAYLEKQNSGEPVHCWEI